MPDSDVLPLDDAATRWQGMAERIERFVAAWDAAVEPPSIAPFLDDSSPVARRMTAIELIKIDLEYRRLRRGEAKPLEAYFAEYPFLGDEPPVDLIYEECHLRRRAGETFDAEEACRRFPAQAAELRRLFGAAPALQTTTRMSPPPTVAAKLEPGDRVDDFELLARLGEGAFGTVYLARQKTMQRLVALKVTADRGSEPQTLAQLDHEHIVRVFDQRQLADRGLRLMYMQFAAGGTLEEALRRLRSAPLERRTGRDFLDAVDAVLAARGDESPGESAWRTRLASMSWPEAVCFLGARLAQALDYAHGRGVLHRDVKPANVLLTAEGSPKLADFNISYSSKLDGATPAAYFGGSLAYMSPEQLQACNPMHDRTPDQLDGRSDLYSLGIVLWEMLVGERPFDDDRVERSWSLTLEQMTTRRQRGPAAHRLAEVVADSTPGLDVVLTQCLAADPAKRFASGRELARRLDLCRLPRTQRLLGIRRDGWRGLLLRHPAMAVVVLTVLPNAVAGAFNYVYNLAEIVGRLGPNAEAIFQQTQTTINVLLFPLGAAIGTYRMLHIARLIADDRRRDALDDDRRRAVRENVLLIGRDAALIGLTLWIFAGGLYPMLMHWGLGRAALSTYAHFFASMLLCGLIAAAYPFWLVTLLSVRRYYPLFVRPEGLERSDRGPLERLRRMGWFFLGLTALVPMTAVALLALVGSRAEFALATSAVGGMVGFVAALFALRRLLADVDALLPLTRTEIDRPPTVT